MRCNSEGNVVELAFARQELKGEILNEEIIALRHLAYIDLSNNEITGEIPYSIGQLNKVHISHQV